MSYWSGSGVEDWDTTTNVTCNNTDCQAEHDDVDVTVRDNCFVYTCPKCDSESEYELTL